MCLNTNQGFGTMFLWHKYDQTQYIRLSKISFMKIKQSTFLKHTCTWLLQLWFWFKHMNGKIWKIISKETTTLHVKQFITWMIHAQKKRIIYVRWNLYNLLSGNWLMLAIAQNSILILCTGSISCVYGFFCFFLKRCNIKQLICIGNVCQIFFLMYLE